MMQDEEAYIRIAAIEAATLVMHKFTAEMIENDFIVSMRSCINVNI